MDNNTVRVSLLSEISPLPAAVIAYSTNCFNLFPIHYIRSRFPHDGEIASVLWPSFHVLSWSTFRSSVAILSSILLNKAVISASCNPRPIGPPLTGVLGIEASERLLGLGLRSDLSAPRELPA